MAYGSDERIGDIESFSRLDRTIASAHRFLILRNPVPTLSVSLLVYLGVVLIFGNALGVSANYFVILPIFAFALVFGLSGGLVAGAAGLPANLLLFFLLGHVEYAPENAAIAEGTGLFIGAVFGYLADFFGKLRREVDRRARAETELRRGYAEKDLLLRELQHRVKNNLNMIKSIVSLQRNRSADPLFREASGLLLSRIYAIAYAHDALFVPGRTEGASGEEGLDLSAYLRQVAESAVVAFADLRVAVDVAVEGGPLATDKNTALNLGLVVNELAVNASKHAYEGVADPRFSVRVRWGADGCRLAVRDNGRGFPEGSELPSGSGLGRAIVSSVASRLGGELAWRNDGGAVFELSFPPPRGQ